MSLRGGATGTVIRMRCLSIFMVFLLALTGSAMAESRETIGSGRLFSNDFFGDGSDRWRTGSYVRSTLRAKEVWDGEPRAFGDVLEYRLRSEIISSDGRGDAPDRPYVGALSVGVHSHYGQDSFRGSVGLDLMAIGPQTGVSRFQERFHDRFGLAAPRFTDGQLRNAYHLGLTAEAAEVLPMSPDLMIRPFAEIQVGAEDLMRVGADVLVGDYLQNNIMLRDVTTGHLYRGTQGSGSGLGFVVGADMAAVAGSVYLPDARGVAPLDQRARLRAGVHWQSEDDSSVFYGLTYLTPEFDSQAEGQVTGSLRLNFNF